MAEREGSFMQTHSGRVFWPLDPRADEVDPGDVAHALSMQCRYAGHCLRFYCPTPDQRVLTLDMRWVQAGDLKVGDELLAFDEQPFEVGSLNKKRRRFRPAIVTATQDVKREVYRLVLEDGSSVKASAEHPWLVATKASRNQKWLRTDIIAADIAVGRKRYMHKFIEPWVSRRDYQAGWFAGIMDGEGHISFQGRRGVQFGVAQRPGVVLNEIERVAADMGFKGSSRPVGASDVQSFQLHGGWREMLRLVGSVRPLRLLNKIQTGIRTGQFDKQMDGVREPLQIVAAYREGEHWVSGLETSTHTYLCEGYGAHNSVAEHSVLVARYLMAETGNRGWALWGLLHDAAEAYCVDVPRPLKGSLPGYKEIERGVMDAVCDRFGLPLVMPLAVKLADDGILVDERAQNMAPCDRDWKLVGPGLGVTLRFWSPQQAETAFLAELRKLLDRA